MVAGPSDGFGRLRTLSNARSRPPRPLVLCALCALRARPASTGGASAPATTVVDHRGDPAGTSPVRAPTSRTPPELTHPPYTRSPRPDMSAAHKDTRERHNRAGTRDPRPAQRLRRTAVPARTPRPRAPHRSSRTRRAPGAQVRTWARPTRTCANRTTEREPDSRRSDPHPHAPLRHEHHPLRHEHPTEHDPTPDAPRPDRPNHRTDPDTPTSRTSPQLTHTPCT